ncbi:GntR family transcriptional regulator [Agrobacterium tumefaciens]|uniref:GntR family transcriptional regulator n=1 Tax=Agrobacterium tumefaciens TaxID=358 RepID=A0AA44FCC9_AGRTU|nr:GntR family transcriptional regulator [Agrobacterium tumefaciens]NTB87761.1 GntR family transcriptional regulator [Agrobacterium tumefaciens]NTC32016.1 GntR family transcriptional regulator [Agrobacterium tumefaciens]
MQREQPLFPSHEDLSDDHDKAGQVYARIRSVLTSYRVPPSTFLNIRTIAKALNVSPTPVREALIRLANEELVLQASAGRGYFSRLPSVDRLAAEYEAAYSIICYAIRKNAPDFSLTGLRPPKEYRVDAPGGDVVTNGVCSFVVFLESLYQRLVAISGNPILEAHIQHFIDRTSFIREFDLLKPHRQNQIMENMVHFIELLESGRSEDAIVNLEQQLEAKTRLLPELVHGVLHRSVLERSTIEALLCESPLKG